jgi:hypothetical protein
VDRRGHGTRLRIAVACRAYYRLPDCRKDGGQFARGAAVLLAEDRWQEFEPLSLAKPHVVVAASPEVLARRAQHFRDTGEWKPTWGERPVQNRSVA